MEKKFGIIVWVHGLRKGKVKDFAICRDSGILDLMVPQEQFTADKGYVFIPRFIVPYQGHVVRNSQQFFHNRVWSGYHHIERKCNGRIVKFKALVHLWRHSYIKYRAVLYAVINIVNLCKLYNAYQLR